MKSGRATALTTHLRLSPRLKKEWTYNSTPFLRLHGLFWGELYLCFYTWNWYSCLSVSLLLCSLKMQWKCQLCIRPSGSYALSSWFTLWLRVCYVWDITAASNPGWDILCPVKKPRLLFPSDAKYGLKFVGRHWVICECTCRLTWCIFFTWSYVSPQICSLCAANLLLLRCWVMLKHTVVVKI